MLSQEIKLTEREKSVINCLDGNDLFGVFHHIKNGVNFDKVINVKNHCIVVNGVVEPHQFQDTLSVYIMVVLLLDEYGHNVGLKNEIVDLIFKKSNLNNRYGNDSTILHLFVERNNKDYLPKLFEYRDRLNIELKNNGGFTPFHTAILTMNLPMALYFIDKGCDVKTRNYDNKTVLSTLANFFYFNSEYINKVVDKALLHELLEKLYIKGCDFECKEDSETANFMQQSFLRSLYEEIVVKMAVKENYKNINPTQVVKL